MENQLLQVCFVLVLALLKLAQIVAGFKKILEGER